MQRPKPGNIVRHKKTGNQYIVMDVAIDCTNSRDGTATVIYSQFRPRNVRPSNESIGPFVRELSEFCDGRFELVL